MKNEKGKNIYWITDSEVMTQVLKKGSHRPILQKLVFQVANLCSELQIRIEPIHLRREDPRIQMADTLSKTKDTDNWSIDEASFQFLNEQFRFETDIFADKNNRRTPRFFSKYFDQGTSGVDAFSMPWGNWGMLWICPPVSELVKTHRRIIGSQVQGVIILPRWQTSSFIHLFIDEEGQVKAPYQLIQEWHPYITQNEGATNTALFGVTNFPLLALSFNF